MPQVGGPVIRRHGVRSRRFEERPGPRDLGAKRFEPALLLSLLDGEGPLLRHQARVLRGDERQLERPTLRLERLVLQSLLGLTLQGGDLAADLVHDVPDAKEILARRLELAERLRPLLLVARDPRGLLDEDAPVEGLRGQDVGEALLLHEGVGLRVDPGPQEQVVDVLETADRLVEQVLRLPVPVEPPADRDLAPGYRHLTLVREREEGLGQSERTAGGGPVEDHVLHPLAPQRLRALLTEGPAQGIGDVRLAAAVRTDDGGDAREDLELRPVDEGLEAEERDRQKPHEPSPTDSMAVGRSPREKIPGVGPRPL